jgi:hypothetical protein
MRVMCITGNDFTEGKAAAYDNIMEVGDEFTVERECVGYGVNGLKVACYKLAEVDFWLFDKRNFATLPDSTADDMQEVEKEAIVNFETVAA